MLLPVRYLRKRKRAEENTPKTLKYLHITKCGGTSIEDLTMTNYKWGRFDADIRDATSEISIADGSFWHVPPRYFLKEYLKPMLKKADLFVSVRNPFTRVISEYYCKWGGPKHKHASIYEFNQWINNKLIDINRQLQIAVERRLPVHGHWIPQYLYLTDHEGNKLVNDSNVIHLENFDEEFEELMHRYNIHDLSMRRRGHVIHSLRTECKFFEVKDLSAKNIALIRNIYEKDFLTFGYNIEDPSSLSSAYAFEFKHERSSLPMCNVSCDQDPNMITSIECEEIKEIRKQEEGLCDLLK